MANIIVAGKQITDIWHVGGFKVSCRDFLEITKFANITNIWGHKSKKKTSPSVPWHDANYSITGQMTVSMTSYKKNTTRKFPETIQGLAVTPVGDYLFHVQDSPKPLFIFSEEQEVAFYQMVTQLLFISASV